MVVFKRDAKNVMVWSFGRVDDSMRLNKQTHKNRFSTNLHNTFFFSSEYRQFVEETDYFDYYWGLEFYDLFRTFNFGVGILDERAGSEFDRSPRALKSSAWKKQQAT